MPPDIGDTPGTKGTEGNARRRTIVVVALTAGLAMIMRFPSWLWPIRPDEAGFTLVARELDPSSEHLFGPHFVDRPPPIIGLVRVSDAIGGPMFIRVLAMLACALLVVLAARTAYLLGGHRAARWTAVGTMAIATNPMIDSVAAKGEIFGLPVVVGSILLALEALRLRPARPRAALLAAGAAGGCGMIAIGLKQNLMSGLAFGGVLLVVSLIRRELPLADFARLAGAALAGALLPLLLTLWWTAGQGVDLHVLWDTVFGFRSEALTVIDTEHVPNARKWRLLGIGFATGLGLACAWFLVNLRRVWTAQPAVVCATVAILVLDTAGLVLGGSYWRTYLLGLVPAAMLALALTTALTPSSLTSTSDLRGRVARGIVIFSVVSALVAAIGWTRGYVAGSEPPDEIYVGRAIANAADQDDSIVVFGGRADIVMASGLRAPYEHLWGLPAQALDSDLAALNSLLDGQDRPTWFVEAYPLADWNGTGLGRLRSVLAERYTRHGSTCAENPIYLVRGVDRPIPAPRCGAAWHEFTLFGNGF